MRTNKLLKAILRIYYSYIKRMIPRSIIVFLSPVSSFITKTILGDTSKKDIRKVEAKTEKYFNENRKLKKQNDTAVILHLYYEDLWGEIKENLLNLGDNFDLYISISDNVSSEIIKKIKKDYSSAHIFVFENRGRDILPFIKILKRIYFLNYKYICKIHTKKSSHRLDGEIWRKELIKSLLGSKDIIEKIKKIFDENKKIGMILPKRYFLKFYIEKDQNKLLIEELSRSNNIDFQKEINFPAGSMFWFRSIALEAINELKIKELNFPEEAGQVDGTLAHAIERIFFLMIRKKGYDIELI